MPWLFAAVQPANWSAVLAFYTGYAISASGFISSLYLFLPILRNAESAAMPLIDYELVFLEATARFSLFWWMPFVLVVLSAALLALSKRLEYRIWSFAHREFWKRYRAVFIDDGVETKRHRRVERAAKTRAMALRWLALLGMDLLKSSTLLLLLIWIEPLVIPVVASVLVLLMLIFRDAIWSKTGDMETDSDCDPRKLESLIRLRMRLANARQVLVALMPITLLLLLLFSRLGFGGAFDLADLLFLSFLVSAFGNTLADAIQTLIRFQQLDESLLVSWGPLSRGDRAAFLAALRRGHTSETNDGDLDD